MGLMVDRRAEHTPGFHAFIVGVSAYPHLRGGSDPQFGLTELRSAARSADHLYRWLLNAKLAVPLASARLLLSPVAGEILEDNQAEPCTLDNFIHDAYEWRTDASTHRDNQTLFYFAGQGFSLTQGEQALLLQDFGDKVGPLLRNAVSVNNLLYGMAPGVHPDIARTQLYFIDSNRMRATGLAEYQSLNTTAVFDAPLQGTDDRTAAVFYATSTDAAAYAHSQELTLFSRALVQGLNGRAAEPVGGPDEAAWGVSVRSLARYLQKKVRELSAQNFVQQQVGVEGSLGDAMISYLTEPPKVEVSFNIEAAEAATFAIVRMFDAEGQTISEWKSDGQNIGEWKTEGQKLTATVPAGLYQVDLSGERAGTTFSKRKVLSALSPHTFLNVRV